MTLDPNLSFGSTAQFLETERTVDPGQSLPLLGPSLINLPLEESTPYLNHVPNLCSPERERDTIKIKIVVHFYLKGQLDYSLRTKGPSSRRMWVPRTRHPQWLIKALPINFFPPQPTRSQV